MNIIYPRWGTVFIALLAGSIVPLSNRIFAQDQARAVAFLTGDRLARISVEQGGSGYLSPPTVSIVGGGGWGAQASAVVSNGIVRQILISEAGTTYRQAPTVIISPPFDYSSGLLAWWRGESNTLDELGISNGVWVPRSNNRSYPSAMVGVGIYASDNYVSVTNRPEFSFAEGYGDFTIETWLKLVPSPNRETPGIASKYDPFGGGWSFYFNNYGILVFTNYSYWELTATNYLIYNPQWHHVALTKMSDVVTLYEDGLPRAVALQPQLVPSKADLRLGRGPSFFSDHIVIDELAIYDRSLSEREIKEIFDRGSQGKYLRPIIASPPSNTVAILGTNTSLVMKAIGTPPLHYQWLKNGLPMENTTNPVLFFENIQTADTNAYSVIVYNQYGAVTSQEARLEVKAAHLKLGLAPKLAIGGVAGKTYGIQYTTSLEEPVSWTTLTNITLDQPTQTWYDYDADTSLPEQPHRYYQVIAVP
jgi:hypothetical protein